MKALRIISLAIFIALWSGSTILAQDDSEICITYDGTEICGYVDDVKSIIQALSENNEPEGYTFAVSGVPIEGVIPYRLADNGETHEQVCNLEASCFMLGDPGVISTHSWEDSQSNPSAVFISPDTQFVLENETATALLPESGYMMITGAGMTFSVNSYDVTLEAIENNSWLVVLRGLNNAAGDQNSNVQFSDYNPGAVLVTRFPIPVEAGAFFSEEYVGQNVDTALSNNCGDEGCESVSILLLDVNDGAMSVLQTSDGEEFELIFTNTTETEE